jgi:hypothetical protein
MKGIVFNLLEEVVRAEHGEDAWDALLETAGLEGAYTSLGSYPDEELMNLVAAAAKTLGQPPDAIVRWFARQALPLLAIKYPGFFSSHTSTRAFLLTLNDVIHPEVRKLYPGADVPVFDYDTSSPDILIMRYVSPRRLCAFAHGLIEGAAAHYRETLDFRHPKCMKREDPECLFHLSFRPAACLKIHECVRPRSRRP